MAISRRYPRGMPDQLLEPWRPSLDVWHRAIESGALEGENVELVDGAVVAMSPRDAAHEDAVEYLLHVVGPSIGPGRRLRVAGSLTIGEGWEPEPDLYVHDPARPRLWHPSTALWVCEVANSSLRKDRSVKAVGYASAAIPEYWIVSLPDRHVEVLTEPTPGHGYAVTTVTRTGTLRSASLPGLEVDLDDLWAAVLPG